MGPLIHHESIHQLRQHLGFDEPKHPLITVIDVAKMSHGEEAIGNRLSSDMYCIALKDKSCALDYGRNHYDFEEGVMLCTAPKQIITITRAHELGEMNGWLLYFHPDLIRNSPLGSKMDSYSFFSYEVHEALHLSKLEQDTITNCIKMMELEINQRIDNHSQNVLVSNLELLLNYCLRFYERQFNTRAPQHHDVVSQVENLLKSYYETEGMLEKGQPSVKYLAEACNLSPGYLSDLLRKETGRSTKEHINDFIIDKAKNLLLGSSDTVSGIAYQLGFNYPHYFGRLFKNKTGLTPQEYRDN